MRETRRYKFADTSSALAFFMDVWIVCLKHSVGGMRLCESDQTGNVVTVTTFSVAIGEVDQAARILGGVIFPFKTETEVRR